MLTHFNVPQCRVSPILVRGRGWRLSSLLLDFVASLTITKVLGVCFCIDNPNTFAVFIVVSLYFLSCHDMSFVENLSDLHVAHQSVLVGTPRIELGSGSYELPARPSSYIPVFCFFIYFSLPPQLLLQHNSPFSRFSFLSFPPICLPVRVNCFLHTGHTRVYIFN